MRHTRRIMGWVLIGSGILVALVVALVAFVLFTTPGARLALTIANGRELPLHARSIEGALARRFVLHDVELRVGPVWVKADTVEVAWHPLELRAHRLHLDEAIVAGARVVITADTTESAPSTAGKEPSNTAPPKESSHGKPWVVSADRLRVRRASLEAPGNVQLHDVDITASGGPDGYRGDVRASGSAWRLSGMSLFVRASGNTSAAHADSLDVHVLGGAVRGSAFVRWDPGLSWKARVQGDSVRAGDLFGASEWLGPVSFRASGTGLVHDDSMQIATDVQSLEGTLQNRPLAARARINVDGKGVEASDAWVKWGSSQATFSGRMADVVTLHIDASVPALGEILPDARGAVSVRATLSGSPSQIDVNAGVRARRVHAAGFDVPDLDATVAATVAAEKYMPRSADVRSATIRIGESRIDARGSVSWRDGIEWNGSVAADRFETSTLAPARWNLHGPLSLRATTAGAKRGRHLSARLALESLTGMLRKRAVSGDGSIAVKDGEADLSALRFAWGDARLSAHGHAGRTMNLEFDAAAPNLAAIDSSLHGGVTLRGAVTGAQKKPRVNADITADTLRVREYGAGRLEGHVDADLAFKSPADVHLLALRASRGESEADTVRVDITGPRHDLRASVAAVKGIRRAALVLHGALGDSTWSGWIEDVKVRPDSATAEWRSRGRAPLFVSRSRVRVDSLVLAHGDARISAHAAWERGDTTHAELDVHGFELSTFERYLDETTITGTLNGDAVATIDPSGRITGRLNFVPGPGEIVQGGRRVGYEGRIAGRADASGVSAQVDLALKERSVGLATVNAKLSIAGFVAGRDSLGAQPLEGALDVDCPNIAPVLSLIDPSWSKSAGVLTAHITPTGTAADFRLGGRVALENGSLNLPSGLRLRRTRLELVASGDGSVSLDGEVTSGGGRVILKANSARSKKNGWLNGTFTAKGERFQALNQPEAQVFVSPDIEVKLEERVATVTGRVGVPYARIETAEVPASAASQSKDVVFVEDSLAAKPRVQVRTMVRVELGDSVTFNGFGLRARLVGSLAVDDERGRPTQGTGEIQIMNGKYRAFGNELTIDPGRFIFGGGPIDNPGLDIRAYRGLTTQNVMASSGEMVGMKLFGTLRKPEFTVFSNPPMSQSEIMSYLVTGRPMSTGGDQSALANAAMLVGMQKGGNMVGGMGKKLSLDEAYLEGGQDVKETAFVAGKYLSPKLYVSYATGLFENVNTFRARYSLTHKWTLQTETGKESGTDLLYWFERGK